MTDAPFIAPDQIVEADWIDYNGHLNMAFYNVLFDRASDHAFAAMGMGPAYAETRRHTTYIAETHILYRQELHAGDRVSVDFRILDHDGKRIRAFQVMRHESGFSAATMEALWLHVAMAGADGTPPRVVPFPDDIATRITAMASAHAGLPLPEEAGRSVAIRRRPVS